MNSLVLSEVKAMLAKDELLLGSIFNAMEAGLTNALEIAENLVRLTVVLCTTTKK